MARTRLFDHYESASIEARFCLLLAPKMPQIGAKWRHKICETVKLWTPPVLMAFGLRRISHRFTDLRVNFVESLTPILYGTGLTKSVP